MRDSGRDRPSHSATTAAPEIDFDAEHRPDAAHRVSAMLLRRHIQKQAISGASHEDTHAAAQKGVASPTTSLPFADQIQSSFGSAHDVSKISAHVGGDTASAMGATAYASGNHVVFDRSPDLHTAAHEAAHVIQQAQGVNLYGGVGEAGDSYERHADAVADRVVAGQSAADLLGASTGMAGQGTVQKKDSDPKEQSQRLTAEAYITAIHRSTRRVQLATKIVEDWLAMKIPEQGLGDHKKVFREQYGVVEEETRQLGFEMTDPKIKELPKASSVDLAMRDLDSAVDQFIARYQQAVDMTSSLNDPVTAEGHPFRSGDFTQRLSDIHKTLNTQYQSVTTKPVGVGLSDKARTNYDHDVADGKKAVDSLTETSLYDSLDALSANGAYLVAMGETGTEVEIQKAVARARGNAIEVHRLMGSIAAHPSKEHSTKHANLIPGITALEDYMTRKPSLREAAPDLVPKLKAIHTWLAHR